MDRLLMTHLIITNKGRARITKTLHTPFDWVPALGIINRTYSFYYKGSYMHIVDAI